MIAAVVIAFSWVLFICLAIAFWHLQDGKTGADEPGTTKGETGKTHQSSGDRGIPG